MSQRPNKVEMKDDFWQHQVDPLSDRELEILRHVAGGSSDREIAEALFLSPNTVKWHNRQIYSKLGVSSRTQAVALASQAGLLDDQPARLDVSVSYSRHKLPAQVTSFIGRSKEIAEVRELLDSVRLLTLTGPGGVGKTRLATQAAIELAEAGTFEDGILFVDLAPLSQPEQVGDSIVEALGIMAVVGQPIPKVLENHLRKKKLLLLLDNFEHLLDAAPLVGNLLAAAPDLSFLVTSREALSLYGEQEYPVPPLRLPDEDDSLSPSTLIDHEASALFIQRAQAVKPNFSLTNEDAPRVAEICKRLDGLPLAIELAAAQVKLFSLHTLQRQLESRFTALKDGPRGLPERQRTLRGAIEWSYELLDDAEKKLFTRLSVFQGGRTIEAVDTVCCQDLPIDVLDGLASLLNKNLLRLEEGPEDEPRFTMLETIHEYARERLKESGEAEDIHRRHAEFFTALAERAEPYTRGGSDQMLWFTRLEAEHDNLRAMYRWSMDGGNVELALRLVGTLGYFWWRQGHYTEGRQWTEHALEVVEGAPPAVRASVFSAAGRVAFYLDDRTASKHVLGQALTLYQELGDHREIGWTLIHLTMPKAGQRDEYEEAVANCEDGLSLLREVDDKPGVAQGYTNIGELERLNGDLPQAKEAYEKSRDVAREINDGLRESILLINLGFIALHEDDAEGAQAMLKESLILALEIGHTAYTADKLSALAGAVVAMRQPERAARLLGAADALYETQGYIPQAGDIPEFERFQAAAREQLDAETFEKAWAEGRAMKHDEAIAYALNEPTSSL